ncbi:response regulator containing a CheY-like receiver domain and a GGDEF domain [Longilinea arvoryzae]|uniref:Response regulator containing a CheY-like receiver domain and a GGDEF domain n=1 Tax=Longilinea arvoryzae TaxID=360412 RepID=A0A0S7BCZ3_9CHLR|nr:response regulator [Longilinea arvoryzae]GAP15582.1 response regulator containing a CheY-like receiver domain and a GGDEF domain [Longilinea arvoryzae]
MEEKNTLLIVEDDLDIADMLNAYFRGQGYEVLTVNWGEDGVRAAQTNLPQLVILDIRLPDIDGFEVARRLRENRRTRDIPIIFLTEKRERSSRLRGLELRADDYITKPFDIQELRLRVQNAIDRAGRTSLTDPVTQLPQANLVEEQLENCLKKGQQAILLVSLQNIDRFREVYGIVAADDLLRATARMLQELARVDGQPDNFVGQYDRSNFILLTSLAESAVLTEKIRKHIEQSFAYFYSEEDRTKGRFEEKGLMLKVHQLQASAFGKQGLTSLKAELGRLAQQRLS